METAVGPSCYRSTILLFHLHTKTNATQGRHVKQLSSYNGFQEDYSDQITLHSNQNYRIKMLLFQEIKNLISKASCS